MKFYKDRYNEVFIISDGHEHLIRSDWVEITESEKKTLQQGLKELTAERIEQIKARLDMIDFESIRPLRAIATDTADLLDHKKLDSLTQERNSLIKELSVNRRQ